MANELEITQAEMNNELDESINNATAIITKIIWINSKHWIL